MPRVPLLAVALAAACVAPVAPALADDDTVAPNPHLQVSGVPAIPASLMRALAPYTEFRPRAVASWHPVRREIVVATRAGNTVQLHAVDAPLAPLRQLTDYAEPVRRGQFWPRKPDTLVFTRDTGGNEQTRLFRLDPGAREAVALTDASVRSAPGALDHARRRVLVASVPLDKTGRHEAPQETLTLLDPLQPQRARTLATLSGTGWGDFSFSFDDRKIALVEFKSVEDSRVHVMDVETGKLTQVLPKPGSGTRVTSDNLAFAADGRHVFLATDAGGEFRRAALLSLRDGKLRFFGPEGADVEELTLSPDGHTVALVVNRNGVGELAVYDASTLRLRPTPALPPGTVSGAIWHENSRDIAFNLNSARSPGDVWSIEVPTGELTRWTETRVEGLDASTFVTPAPIAWQTFDGRVIHGFITRPPARHAGKRPVLIAIHGGPEAQARPSFLGRSNYLVNELGIAVIEPNVRGSTGYGRTFVSLDNGVKREDSVRDIGSLLDWIAAQPDLDASRVAVYGGSYGGYMSLAVATHYSDRIAGSVDVVGIANFVSFLEHTESYRRDLRRVEYGDERDAAMREILTRISPVTNAGSIRKPLLVAQGRNDPRVPYTESEQIVTTVRRNDVPVWYILADNEGHGFARKDNADYFFAAMTLFLKQVLAV